MRYGWGAWVLGAVVGLSTGCTVSRMPVAEAVLVQRREDLIADQNELLVEVNERLVRRLEERRDVQGGGDQSDLDLLIISAGGDWGAFGAGFLAGWGDVKDPVLKRPDFDLVCGLSTGALMAPFAFVGRDEDYERIEWFYRHPGEHWTELRDWFAWLPWRPSIMSNDGIREAIAKAVNRDTVARIAERSRGGGVLLVAATNLDHGSMVVWELGDECQRAFEKDDRDRVVSLLLASTAIPAAFPPVSVDNALYADGGITSIPLLSSDCYPPTGFMSRWREEHPSARPPLIRYWVLMNIRVQVPSTLVEPNWSSVAEAALAASIRSSTWLQTRLLAAQLDYINAKGWARCELRAASIPDEWRPSTEGEFQAETMNELADLGRKMGANAGSWRLLTRPLEHD